MGNAATVGVIADVTDPVRARHFPAHRCIAVWQTAPLFLLITTTFVFNSLVLIFLIRRLLIRYSQILNRASFKALHGLNLPSQTN